MFFNVWPVSEKDLKGLGYEKGKPVGLVGVTELSDAQKKQLKEQQEVNNNWHLIHLRLFLKHKGVAVQDSLISTSDMVAGRGQSQLCICFNITFQPFSVPYFLEYL